jgi:predicted metal-dependent hydrolase
VRFAVGEVPLHWIGGDAHTSHVADVLHLLLPAGERWFCRVFKQVAPEISDARLAAELDGFVRQEATHARQHAVVLEHLAAHGLATRAYTKDLDWLFDRLLGDQPLGRTLSPALARRWLHFRVAAIAAIEHLTSILGAWIVESRGLDRAGAHAVMLELLRWHGAEEVEHRAVAFDVSRALGVGWAQRQLAMAIVLPLLTHFWVRGVEFLMQADPQVTNGHASWGAFFAAGRRGTLPTLAYLLGKTALFLSPRFHPSQEGSLELARAFLDAAPGVRAAS